jgi:uncharacterized protein (TIGR03905 family)
METINFKTTGTCAKEINIILNESVIVDIKFIGGCPGGLSAVARLLIGHSIFYAHDCLSGIICGTKETSCVDQLATALIENMIGGANGSE